MAFPFLALQLAIDLAFVALAARTIASWVAAPDPRHGTLAIALSALAVMMLLAPVLGRSGPAGQVITDVAAAVFLISGYGLLAFRNTFVPFRPTTMRVLIVAIVAIGVLDVLVQLPAAPDSPHRPIQTVALTATLGLWSFCMGWGITVGKSALDWMERISVVLFLAMTVLGLAAVSGLYRAGT